MVCLFSAYAELASTSAHFEAAITHAGLANALASLHTQLREHCGASAAHALRAAAASTSVQMLLDDQDCFALLARSVLPVSSPGVGLWKCLSSLLVCASCAPNFSKAPHMT